MFGDVSGIKARLYKDFSLMWEYHSQNLPEGYM